MFYDNLVDACARNKCKVTPVVLECGGAKGSIANWKKGSAPNSDIVVKLAVRLNVTTDFLLRGIQNDTAFLSDDQKQLLMYYNSVDELAQARISERAETLAEQQAEDSPTSLKIPHGIMQDSSSQRDVNPSGRWIPPENSHLSMILSIPPKAL